MAFFDWLPPVKRLSWQINSNWHSIKVQILNDPYYRLQSAEEVAVAAELGLRIDVNHATVDDWLRLPGLSIHQARCLVELSRSGVAFLCLEDIAAALGMSQQGLKPLEPVLRFCYYDTESLYTPAPVNPNTASIEQLIKIPGIDSLLASAIVQNRRTAGPYRNLVDFQQRLALTSQLITQLMHYLRF